MSLITEIEIKKVNPDADGIGSYQVLSYNVSGLETFKSMRLRLLILKGQLGFRILEVFTIGLYTPNEGAGKA